MTSNDWQLIVGVLVALDFASLVAKWRRERDAGILSAILPRAYLATLYLIDACVPRESMEPMRSLTYLGLALLFLTANVNHFAAWRERNRRK